jgi:hypothetical protein
MLYLNELHVPIFSFYICRGNDDLVSHVLNQFVSGLKRALALILAYFTIMHERIIVVYHHSITSWLVSNLQIRAAIARSIHSVTFQ